MPHFRVDDALHGHPKARKAGFEAMGLWVMAGSYCMAYLTDGFVPEWWICEKPRGKVLAKRLVSAELWHQSEHEGERGWQFHDWLGPGRQDSKEKVEAEREAARKRKADWRASQRESQGESPPESQRDTPRDERQESRRSPGTNPTQPNPTQVSTYVFDEAHESNTRGISATPGADLVREIIPPGHPPATLTSLRLQASELLNTGTDRETVVAALRLWVDKPSVGNGRTILASLCSEAIKARAAPANGSKPSKLRTAAELTARQRALEQTQLETSTARRAIE